MKKTNLKVVLNAAGEIEVVGLKKDGTPSAVNYAVTEVVGLREFAKEMMALGAKKQLEAMTQKAERSEAAPQPPTKPESKPGAKVNDSTQVERDPKKLVYTKGAMFTDIKRVGTRAVQFNIADQGECTIGFAKDRNAFLEAFDGKIKEVTRTEVVRRLSTYQGKDARALVKAINNLKPVSMDADVCSSCGCGVVHKVKEYSLRKHDAVLCRDCQKKAYKKNLKEQLKNAETPVCECCELVDGKENLNADGWCASCVKLSGEEGASEASASSEKTAQEAWNEIAKEMEEKEFSQVVRTGECTVCGKEDDVENFSPLGNCSSCAAHEEKAPVGVVGLDAEDLALI